MVDVVACPNCLKQPLVECMPSGSSTPGSNLLYVIRCGCALPPLRVEAYDEETVTTRWNSLSGSYFERLIDDELPRADGPGIPFDKVPKSKPPAKQKRGAKGG